MKFGSHARRDLPGSRKLAVYGLAVAFELAATAGLRFVAEEVAAFATGAVAAAGEPEAADSAEALVG
jgi:hypothetical protein